MMTMGPWQMETRLEDGARIERLQYRGVDLLTRPSAPCFPSERFGAYEQRPVYGYDDCFPTVKPCDGWPDHGEVCWLPWTGTAADCRVKGRREAYVFSRKLDFSERELLWTFAVTNEAGKTIPFKHTMHPLMPLADLVGFSLPACQNHDSAALAADLLATPSGQAQMLYLTGVRAGHFSVRFRQGIQLTVEFPLDVFGSLGIWWNNGGYPAPGYERKECAFEPVSGPSGQVDDGPALLLAAGETRRWQVRWLID